MNKNDSKELNDIISDYNKTNNLLNSGECKKLRMHLDEIYVKYCIKYSREMILYKMTNNYPTNNVYQKAIYCLNFLRSLAEAKGYMDLVNR